MSGSSLLPWRYPVPQLRLRGFQAPELGFRKRDLAARHLTVAVPTSSSCCHRTRSDVRHGQIVSRFSELA
jgi:hypothetical protein